MERWKSDVPDSFQTLANVRNVEDGRQPVYKRPAGVPIRMREIDCVWADIYAEIQMLRRERSYLRLVRREMAARKPVTGSLLCR